MMPRPDSNAGDEYLRLDLGVDGVPLSRLIEAQVAFLGMVREVSESVVGDRDGVRWIVTEVLGESVDFVVHPEPARPAVPQALMGDLIRAVANGMAAIEREAVRPPHFSNRALDNAKTLAKLRGRGITSIRVRTNVLDAAVTTRTIANVEEVIGRPILAIGTVEGRLEALTVHGRRVFFVYDPLTRERIECDFGRRIETSSVAGAVEHRVAVTGQIRYRDNGTLERIRAETIFVFPAQDTLPTTSDVRGILAD